MPSRVGLKLRALRQRFHLSQLETANLLGLSFHSTISGIETARRAMDVPSLELVIAVAALFGVSVDYLIRDEIDIDKVGWPKLQRSGVQISEPRLIGQKLRAWRLQQQMTQTTVADALGVSRATVANIEGAHKLPSLSLLVKIADLMESTADYLAQDHAPILGGERTD